MELSKKTIFVLLSIGVIVAVLIVWKKNKDKKEKAKAELKEQINAGAGTFSGGATVGVKPDDTYDPTMDVEKMLSLKGYWLTDDDEDGMLNILQNLGTKARLVKFRNAFKAKKGRDFEDWLINHVGLDSEETARYRSIIQSLK